MRFRFAAPQVPIPKPIGHWLVIPLMNFVLIAWPSATRAQLSNLAPSYRAPGATISVREIQIPAKARDDYQRGLERLWKGDPAGSLPYFNKALQKFPNYYEAYYHHGVAEMQLNHTNEAFQAFQKAIDLSAGRYTRAYFGYALLLVLHGKPREAEPIVRQALEQDPSISDGRMIFSIVLLKENRFDEAEKSVRETLQMPGPSARKALLVLADIHVARGDYRSAVQDLENYLKLEPSDPHKQTIQNAIREADKLVAQRAGRN